MKSRPDVRPCNCGSGLSSAWTYDAKGVEIARVCDRCRDRVLDAYRPEILTDAAYELDEPLDDDPGFLGGLDDASDWGSEEDSLG